MLRMICIGALAVAALSVNSAGKAEIVVQNDSMPPNGIPLSRIPSGWRVGAWLTAPVDGTIVGVQILWGSTAGNTAPAQEAAIRISDGHFDPVSGVVFSPDTTLAMIAGPTLVDGDVNE